VNELYCAICLHTRHGVGDYARTTVEGTAYCLTHLPHRKIQALVQSESNTPPPPPPLTYDPDLVEDFGRDQS
jgi:hypothetical protein